MAAAALGAAARAAGAAARGRHRARPRAGRAPAACCAAPAYTGLHHVGVLCADVQKSVAFYTEVMGLTLNDARPDDRLPYDGAWLWIGKDQSMIHLMELPNPDPVDGRPDHGGRDRHAAFGIDDVKPLVERLERHGVPYTMSKSGRAAVFFRDPDGNAMEFMEL